MVYLEDAMGMVALATAEDEAGILESCEKYARAGGRVVGVAPPGEPLHYFHTRLGGAK